MLVYFIMVDLHGMDNCCYFFMVFITLIFAICHVLSLPTPHPYCNVVDTSRLRFLTCTVVHFSHLCACIISPNMCFSIVHMLLAFIFISIMYINDLHCVFYFDIAFSVLWLFAQLLYLR